MGERRMTDRQRKRALELAREYEHCHTRPLSGHMELVSTYALECRTKLAALRLQIKRAERRVKELEAANQGWQMVEDERVAFVAAAEERVTQLEAQIIADAAAYGEDRAHVEAQYEERVAALEGALGLSVETLEIIWAGGCSHVNGGPCQQSDTPTERCDSCLAGYSLNRTRALAAPGEAGDPIDHCGECLLAANEAGDNVRCAAHSADTPPEPEESD